MEWRVWSVECVECVECEVWSVMCGMQSVEVRCGV